MKVLVIDDEMTVRVLLAGLLADVFEEVIEASGGRAGVGEVAKACAMGKPFDLVCLDINMPDLDGHETLRKIRGVEEAFGFLPGRGAARIMMSTATRDPKDVLNAFREQCDAYLVKPVSGEKLHEQLAGMGFSVEYMC